MKAWIINFGNELLIGRIINTNGAWLAERLTLFGINVRRIIVAPDDEEAVDVLREAIKNADIIVCTGGLGPTYDDRTAEFLAKALSKRLVVNPEALEMVRSKYAEAGMELTPERRKMALMPEGAKPIPNPVGFAPGIHVEINGKHIFCLPGVPREMQEMFSRYVERVLREVVTPPCIYEGRIVVEGVPESSLAPYIKLVARECPKPCYIKSHPKGHETQSPLLDIRVLASDAQCAKAEEKVKSAVSKLVDASKRLGGKILEVSTRKLTD